jgi:hypothetical protein
MNHAVVRLNEELRVLMDTRRRVRLDLTTETGVRYRMESQLDREITETMEALLLLRRAMGLTEHAPAFD